MNGAARARLGANECPLPPPARVLEAIATAAGDAARYPSAAAEADLRARLADLHGVAPENVALGHGASELIDLALAAFVPQDDEIVICEPTFPLFRARAEQAGVRVVSVPARDHVHDLLAMSAAVTARTGLIVVVQPNNPTGTIVRREAWRAFLDAISSGADASGAISSGADARRPLVLCDEAYADYVDDSDAPDVLEDVRKGLQVVSLRTFSKARSLAGLRVGYAIASPERAARLEAARLRFSVSGVALAAARASLAEPGHVAEACALARAGKAELQPVLERLGLEVVPSQTNFLLVRLPHGAAGRGVDVCAELARRGVLVCDLSGLGFGMERGWLRITMGRTADHERLLGALSDILAAARTAEG